MKHYFWLLILTAGIMFTGCVSKKQFASLETDYNRLQTEHNDLQRNYQESQLQLAESRTRVSSLEERLAEARKNNDELRAAYTEMQNSLNKSLSQNSQGNVNIAKLVDEINASNRFIQHLVQAKNRSDSLNLVMINNLTRSLTRDEMQDLDIKVLKGVVYTHLMTKCCTVQEAMR